MTQQELLQAYAPSRCYFLCQDEKRCHTGKAPSLRQVCSAYGYDTLSTLASSYLDDFQAYTGARVKLSEHQRTNVVGIVCTQFPSLSLSEFVLFWVKLKGGKWGKFYDRLDPMDITSALSQWDKECNTIKNEEARKAFEEQAHPALRTEYHAQDWEELAQAGIIKSPTLLKILHKWPTARKHQK